MFKSVVLVLAQQMRIPKKILDPIKAAGLNDAAVAVISIEIKVIAAYSREITIGLIGFDVGLI